MATELWLVRKATAGSDPEHGDPTLVTAPAGTDLNASIAATATAAAGLESVRGWISGLVPANAAGDPTNDITFAIGACRNSSDVAGIHATAARTKRADATWAAGDAAGMHPGGSCTAWGAASFHLFVLGKSTDTTAFDFGMDSSVPAANLLANAAVVAAGFDRYRRVGSLRTAGAAWPTFTAVQNSGGGLWVQRAPVIDSGLIKDWSGVDDAAQTGTSSFIPIGVQMLGYWAFMFSDQTAGAASAIVFSSFDVADTAPVSDQTDPATSFLGDSQNQSAGGAAARANFHITELTRASDAAIRYRGVGTTADHSLGSTLKGWTDFRAA